MKKLLAILTVMTMVLTTLVVPTVAFANGTGEGATVQNVNVNIRGGNGNGGDGTFSLTSEKEGLVYYDSPANIYVPKGQSLREAGYTAITLPSFGDGRQAVSWKICEFDETTDSFPAVRQEWESVSNDEILDIIIDYVPTVQLVIMPNVVGDPAGPGGPEFGGEEPDYTYVLDMYESFCNNFFNSILDKDENGELIKETDAEGNITYEVTVNALKPTDELALDTIFSPANKEIKRLYKESNLPYEVYLGCWPITEGNVEKVVMELSVSVPRVDENGNPVFGGGDYQITDNVTVMAKEVNVNYVWDNAIAKKIDNFIKNINLENREFKVIDMELINYWYNISLADEYSEEKALINFSSEFKNSIGSYNFSMTTRMGDAPYYHSFEAGNAALVYNDTFYGFTPYVGAKGEHLIYVAEGTEYSDLADAAKDRIRRYLGEKAYNASNINITQNYDDAGAAITVKSVYDEMYGEYASSIEDWLNQMKADLKMYEEMLDEVTNEDDKKNIAEQVERTKEEIKWLTGEQDQMLAEYEAKINFLKKVSDDYAEMPTFTLEINGLAQNIIIVPDGELEDPSLLTKDFATDIEISTDSTEVPLDSLIEAEKKDEFEDILKEEKGVTEGNSLTYDLKVYSKTLAHAVSNSTNGYITELEDGEFEVVVPIKDTSLEGKKLIAYYVYTDGPGNSGKEQIEEHEVTVENGYAKFKTNHFSTYTLAPVSDADISTPGASSGSSGGSASGSTIPDSSVNTGDDFSAIPYIAVMAIALAGVAVALFRRKTVK